jgi:hypothetical protein
MVLAARSCITRARRTACAALALVLFADATVAMPALAAATGRAADTTGTAKTISISDRGIRIDGTFSGDSSATKGRPRHRMRIRSHDGLIVVDDQGNGEVRIFSDIEIARGEPRSHSFCFGEPAPFAANEDCALTGQYIPFATTQDEYRPKAAG